MPTLHPTSAAATPSEPRGHGAPRTSQHAEKLQGGVCTHPLISALLQPCRPLCFQLIGQRDPLGRTPIPGCLCSRPCSGPRLKSLRGPARGIRSPPASREPGYPGLLLAGLQGSRGGSLTLLGRWLWQGGLPPSCGLQ